MKTQLINVRELFSIDEIDNKSIKELYQDARIKTGSTDIKLYLANN